MERSVRASAVEFLPSRHTPPAMQGYVDGFPSCAQLYPSLLSSYSNVHLHFYTCNTRSGVVAQFRHHVKVTLASLFWPQWPKGDAWVDAKANTKRTNLLHKVVMEPREERRDCVVIPDGAWCSSGSNYLRTCFTGLPVCLTIHSSIHLLWSHISYLYRDWLSQSTVDVSSCSPARGVWYLLYRDLEMINCR